MAAQENRIQDAPRKPRVFVSYAHESEEHSAWVMRLACDLRENGVDALLDAWKLRYGDDVTLFMDSIRSCDRVLLICTPEYAAKANKGEGGVGYERSIITAELAKTINTSKFVCVLRQGDFRQSIPTFLESHLYIDFREEAEYDSRLEELLRDLHDSPRFPEPPVGTNPFEGTSREDDDRGSGEGTDRPASRVVASPSSTVLDTLDIARGSLLHKAFALCDRWHTAKHGNSDTFVPCYLIPFFVVAILSYGAILVAALICLDSLYERSATVTDPFLFDLNAMWQYSVTLPLLIVFLVNDRKYVRDAILEPQLEGVLRINVSEKYVRSWEDRFRKRTIVFQFLGIPIGLCMAWFNYENFTGENSGIWASDGDTLNIPGKIFVFWIAVFYWVLPLYAMRAVTTVSFFRDLADKNEIIVRPDHADRCGGLSAIGRVSVRFVCMLAVVAVNIELLAACIGMGKIGSLSRFLLAGAIVVFIVIGAYLVFGINVPYYKILKRERDKLVRGVLTMHARIQRRESELRNKGDRSPGDYAELAQCESAKVSIERDESKLRQMNVWPFHAPSDPSFWIALAGPIVGLIVSPIMAALLG